MFTEHTGDILSLAKGEKILNIPVLIKYYEAEPVFHFIDFDFTRGFSRFCKSRLNGP